MVLATIPALGTGCVIYGCVDEHTIYLIRSESLRTEWFVPINQPNVRAYCPYNAVQQCNGQRAGVCAAKVASCTSAKGEARAQIAACSDGVARALHGGEAVDAGLRLLALLHHHRSQADDQADEHEEDESQERQQLAHSPHLGWSRSKWAKVTKIDVGAGPTAPLTLVLSQHATVRWAYRSFRLGIQVGGVCQLRRVNPPASIRVEHGKLLVEMLWERRYGDRVRGARLFNIGIHSNHLRNLRWVQIAILIDVELGENLLSLRWKLRGRKETVTTSLPHLQVVRMCTHKETRILKQIECKAKQYSNRHPGLRYTVQISVSPR
eukprot:779734-Prorocentrum_minimum.AAC.2